MLSRKSLAWSLGIILHGGDSTHDRKTARTTDIDALQQVQGTLEQMEHMFSCIDKGCHSDPLPVDEMYLVYEQGQERTLA